MNNRETDFLDVSGLTFSGINDFTSYLKQDVDLQEIDGKLSIIGSIRDFETDQMFIKSLKNHFDIINREKDLILLYSKNKGISHYVYLNGEFPIFLTTARKTEDLPETIWNYLRSEQKMSRMWIAKRQMENLRKNIVQDNPDVVVPYFTGNRSRYSDIAAIQRPDYKRTVQYYGEDGLETFKEMKRQYGILPTNMQFEKPNGFKFRVKQSGIFTINKVGVSEVINIIKDSVNRLKVIKKTIDSSDYREKNNQYAKGELSHSTPWGIKLGTGLNENDIDHFEDKIELDEWEFGVTRFEPSFENIAFDAELIDKYNYGQTGVRSRDDEIRIYPREETGIDQSVRIFNFVNDHIDPECSPINVA